MIDLNNLNENYDWENLEKFVEKEHSIEKTGHGFDHIERTIKIALEIAKEFEGIDYNILVASCLLHDIAYPSKGHKDHHLIGSEMSKEILKKFKFPEDKIEIVSKCILNHAGQIYKDHNKLEELPIEGRILIDADFIDAFGSIGIIRAINFCLKNNIFEYKKGKEDGFNDSIYGTIKGIIGWEKDILTEKGKEMARERVKIMEDFLEEFDKEN